MHNDCRCDGAQLRDLYRPLEDIDREVSSLTDVYLLTFLFLDTISGCLDSMARSMIFTMREYEALHKKYRDFLLGVAKWLLPQDPPCPAPCPEYAIVEQMHHICADYMRVFEGVFHEDGDIPNYDKAVGWAWYVSFSLAPLIHLHLGLNDFSQDRTNSSNYVGVHVQSPSF
jgi:hypothetical protein